MQGMLRSNYNIDIYNIKEIMNFFFIFLFILFYFFYFLKPSITNKTQYSY